MSNKKIPVVFAFDDNYALPASVAIQSLIDSKAPTTEYDVIVLHGGLKKSTMRKIEQICPIRWILVDRSCLDDAPTGWSGIETYYRLLVADLIPDYDKIIWSDVDVLFCADLTDIYNAPMGNADWSGIAAERADEKHGIHPHFPENTKPFIYMPGFMVINAKKWRKENMREHFFDIIKTFGTRLKFFDLDILNLAAKKINDVPFEYCVLENIYDADDIKTAPEYPWLSRVHSYKRLVQAKQNPKIIHYAGGWPKIWWRTPNKIKQNYWAYLVRSPFYNREYYFPGWRTKLKRIMFWPIIKLCPVKSWRKKLKNKIKNK